MRSSSSRAEAVCTEASRNAAALLTQPASGPAEVGRALGDGLVARVAGDAGGARVAGEPRQRGRVELEPATRGPPPPSSRSVTARPMPRPPPVTTNPGPMALRLAQASRIDANTDSCVSIRFRACSIRAGC